MNILFLSLAIIVVLWAIYQLGKIYLIKYISHILIKHKVCVFCIDMREVKFTCNSPWVVKDEFGEMHLCEKCKSKLFTDEITEAAINSGLLTRIK